MDQNIQPQPAAVEKKSQDTVSRHYSMGMLLAIAVTISFIAGVFVGDLRRPSEAAEIASTGTGRVLNRDAKTAIESKDVDFSAFWDIWRTVKLRHVGGEPVDETKMFYGAIAGMVASMGDPYSVFFDPKYADEFAKQLGGEFEGIGAEIGIKQDRLTVIAPLPDSPAEKAGIFAGDRIVGIDDTDTTGMTTDEAVRRIRGDKGTVVKLHIMREGFKEPKEIQITRAKIVVESVKWKMVKSGDKDIAVITLAHFNDKTTAAFANAVRGILPKDPDGIVLDLRNNPGGYLDAAVNVASEWVGDDVVVIEKFGDDTEEDRVYRGKGMARIGDIPTIVLMNGGSASASEILAGALRDHDKAQLVGEKSFGKGSVQDYREYPDGSALKLTVALWYTPKDVNINKEGIAPDVEVKNTPEDFNADRDPQMAKAYELLGGEIAPPVPVAEGGAEGDDAPEPETE